MIEIQEELNKKAAKNATLKIHNATCISNVCV